MCVFKKKQDFFKLATMICLAFVISDQPTIVSQQEEGEEKTLDFSLETFDSRMLSECTQNYSATPYVMTSFQMCQTSW